MANSNNPFGFEPIKSDGKENKVHMYKKAASAIYRGDVLTLTAAGVVQVAAAGQVVCGIAAESKAAADSDIAVYDDPSQEFMVQCSLDFQQTNVGNNADIVANAADSVLSHSKHSIDSASFAVTSTLQFKMLEIHSRGENAAGNYCIVRVKPNNHIKQAGVAGI
jgi:hypothetical protein